MELITQHAKAIMEECKSRARDAGLVFTDESLEYVVTNEDMLELSPKVMIPTLYDYWVHDLEVISKKKEYALYPHNPYETVINSRPPISFYNDNNPDWLNVMIFYHVLGHIDFFQNNSYFEHTWEDDFVGVALADKRLLAQLRVEHGRWVDYVIEFTRGLDNLVGYFDELGSLHTSEKGAKDRFDFFFDVFLQDIKKLSMPDYLKEVENYNKEVRKNKTKAKKRFLDEVKLNYPEFNTLFEKYDKNYKKPAKDLIEFICDNSPFLAKEENAWMKSVMQIVRNTAIYFAPQMRTKILNEGWASYWHQELFLSDSRIKGHEANFAKINALVTSVPKVGFNPYAIGLRLFEFLEDEANAGRVGNIDFDNLLNREQRKDYNTKCSEGRDFMFKIRENFTDFTFLNTFVNQDFVDRYNLAIIGERINEDYMTREFYIKSKKAEDYKQQLLDGLVHPPSIQADAKRTTDDKLVLVHHFEGKQLVDEFAENVLVGLEFLWGGTVELHTYRLQANSDPKKSLYHMKNKYLSKK